MPPTQTSTTRIHDVKLTGLRPQLFYGYRLDPDAFAACTDEAADDCPALRPQCCLDTAKTRYADYLLAVHDRTDPRTVMPDPSRQAARRAHVLHGAAADATLVHLGDTLHLLVYVRESVSGAAYDGITPITRQEGALWDLHLSHFLTHSGIGTDHAGPTWHVVLPGDEPPF